MALFKKKPRTYLGKARCCECDKRLIGEKDVPGWNELTAGELHDVEIVCSSCGKEQYTWNGFLSK